MRIGRKASVGALACVLSLSGCGKSTVPNGEDYTLYSVALAGMLVEDVSFGPVLIRGRAPTVSDPLWSIPGGMPVKPRFPSLSTATWASFLEQNKSWVMVVDSFSTVTWHTVLTEEFENLAVLDPEAWRKAVWQEYGQKQTIVQLSRPGFSRKGDQAVVHISIWCGGPCGFGEYVLLRKENGKWRVEERERSWVG